MNVGRFALSVRGCGTHADKAKRDMIHWFPASGLAGRLSRAHRALLGFCGAALCSVAAGAQAPQVVSATYNLYVNGAHVAVMNETYDAKDSTYRIVSESVPLGALALVQKPAKVVSTGRLTPEGLRPECFEGR